MTLIVLTVIVIALLIAVLAIFLFRIGGLLNRTADNLDDCAQNVKNIAYQAKVIGPGVVRINETGTTVLGALPLLCDGAESVAVAKGAPYVDPSEAPRTAPVAAPVTVPAAAPAMASSTAPPRGLGYMDGGKRGSLGYLDAS
jgi:HAMP domain-containing protein